MHDGNWNFSLGQVQLATFFFYLLSSGFLAGGSLLAEVFGEFFPQPLEGIHPEDVEYLPEPIRGPGREEVEGMTSISSSAGAEGTGSCTASVAEAAAVLDAARGEVGPGQGQQR